MNEIHHVRLSVLQSGELEPLDLGLPISNLDGLRVVLDLAEDPPSQGKGTLSAFGISPCDLSPSLCRPAGRSTGEPKPVGNSKTPPTLFLAVLLAVKMFITSPKCPPPHPPPCSPVPHVTPLSVSLAPPRSPSFVCRVRLASYWLHVFPCTVGCLRDPRHALRAPNVPPSTASATSPQRAAVSPPPGVYPIASACGRSTWIAHFSLAGCCQKPWVLLPLQRRRSDSNRW